MAVPALAVAVSEVAALAVVVSAVAALVVEVLAARVVAVPAGLGSAVAAESEPEPERALPAVAPKGQTAEGCGQTELGNSARTRLSMF